MRPNHNNAVRPDRGVIARGAPPPHALAPSSPCAVAESPQEQNKNRKQKHCVVGRCDMPQEAMLRFVAAPDSGGAFIPDITGKLPGRGAWVEARRETVRAAITGGNLAYALSGGSGKRKRGKAKKIHADADAAEELLQRIDTLLVQHAIHALALGRRSGAVLGGGGKIKAAKTPIAMLLVADDASKREASALAGDVHPDSVMENIMTGAELGVAFARPSLAFVAVLAIPGGDTPRAALKRLAMWRGNLSLPVGHCRPFVSGTGDSD